MKRNDNGVESTGTLESEDFKMLGWFMTRDKLKEAHKRLVVFVFFMLFHLVGYLVCFYCF